MKTRLGESLEMFLDGLKDLGIQNMVVFCINLKQYFYTKFFKFYFKRFKSTADNTFYDRRINF